MKKKYAILFLCACLLTPFMPVKISATAEAKIIFDVNGGDASGKPEDIITYIGASVSLAEINAPTKAGYDFIGWFYNDKQIVETIQVTENKLIIQAGWKQKMQTIVFESALTTATNMPQKIERQYGEYFDVTREVIPQHKRYTFAGWELDKKLITQPIKLSIGTYVFKAKWKGSSETISFDANGGDEQTLPKKLQLPIEETVNISLLDIPIRKGYVFTGWQVKEMPIKEAYVVEEGGANFVAQWRIGEGNLSLTVAQSNVTIEATNQRPLQVVDYFDLTATDIIEGDLTQYIVVSDQHVKYNQIGIYNIVAKVLNARDELVALPLTITIIDTTAPIITSTNLKIVKKIGDKSLTNVQELFAIKAEDIVDGTITAKVQASTYEQYIVGTQTLKFSVVDASGNQAMLEVELVLEALSITGRIFNDINYNSIDDDVQYAAGVQIQLIDVSNKQKVYATALSDMSGKFEFLFNGDKQTEQVMLCVLTSNNLVLPLQDIINGTIINPQTKCSDAMSIKGKDIAEVTIGVAAGAEIVIVQQTVTLNKGEAQQIDMIIENGTIDSLVIDDSQIVDVVKTEHNIIRVTGKQSGETAIVPIVVDKYGEKMEIGKKITVHVK